MRKLLLLYGNDTMVINSTTYEGYSHLMLFIKHHHFSFLLFPRRTPEKQVYRMRMISSSFSTKGSTFNYKTFKKKIFTINKINKCEYKYLNLFSTHIVSKYALLKLFSKLSVLSAASCYSQYKHFH